MSRKGEAYRYGAPYPTRKYNVGQIDVMEHMRYQDRKSILAIAVHFNTTKADIERQLQLYSNYTDAKPLRVPEVSGWDFSGMDVA